MERNLARVLTTIVTILSTIGIAVPSLAAIVPTAPAAVKPQTVVSLTFDDGTAGQMTAASILNASKLKGTFFVNSGTIGLPGYLTRANLAALTAAGHEIGGHSVTHPDLTTLPVGEVQRQICNDRVQLASWGFQTRSFAYPFASTNATVDNIAKACGYNSARNLGDIQTKYGCTGCALSETMPPANPWETKALDEFDNRWTLADLQAPVLAAERRGGWLQYTFHEICVPGGTCGELGITPTLLTQFSQWLATRTTQVGQNTVVKNVGTVIGGTVKPLVNGPAAPPPVNGGNGVNNPGLETVSAGVPSCWWNSSYGTNAPSFSLTAGHSGSVASRITMTGYSSGDAKLLPTFDLGACSPSVASGHTYSLRAWYTSTVVTQFAVYLRTTQGGWVYWTSSPWFAATSTFTQAEFTTPAIPAGYNGISFGLNIFSNGVLTTDDYALYDSVGAPALAPVAPLAQVAPPAASLVPAPQADVSDPATDPAVPSTPSTPPADTSGTDSSTPATPPADTSAPPAPSAPAAPPATPPATTPEPDLGTVINGLLTGEPSA